MKFTGPSIRLHQNYRRCRAEGCVLVCISSIVLLDILAYLSKRSFRIIFACVHVRERHINFQGYSTAQSNIYARLFCKNILLVSFVQDVPHPLALLMYVSLLIQRHVQTSFCNIGHESICRRRILGLCAGCQASHLILQSDES